ncbi:MAG TPA: hypothetical protein PLN13_08460 [Bacteroidia bacterium]|nr:hypothetical protein [Bacteroidia bacterium]HRH08600.1 hypothetical protein [Bacteroidia bacterium]
MLFEKINVELELKQKQQTDQRLMDEVISLFEMAASREQRILKRLKSKPNDNLSTISPEGLDTTRIFSLESIHEICVKYRLRFLDARYFKADFPYEAVQEIATFEKARACRIEQFKIMAPSGIFELSDIHDDPLLFAQLNENTFYLLHRWGKDLKWYRGILNYPFRSIYSFFYSIVVVAGIVAWSFPFEWLNVAKSGELTFRFWLNTHFTIAFFFFFLFLGSLSHFNFSESNWNSRHYNKE